MAMTEQVFLVAVVEVEKQDRIICQVHGCGRSVYRRIHVLLVGGSFTLLGSDCFRRLHGATSVGAIAPYYPWSADRRLTLEERNRLIKNTASFIEQLEQERLLLEEQARKVLTAPIATAVPTRAAAPVRLANHRRYNFYDPAAAPYEGQAVLRWQWVDEQERVRCVTELHRTAQILPRSDLALILQHYHHMPPQSPYQFALGVELKNYLPKKHTLRALHEIGLIEQS
jgi:hypothetical protein